MSKRKALGTVNAVLGYVNPQYHAEVVGNLSSRAAGLQDRLEALDRCIRGRAIALTSSDWKDVFALISGKPAAQCRVALKRWAPRKEGK